MKQNRQSWYIITVFAILKFSVAFVLIHPAFELHRDEFLYLADARHLSWGYIEMPPMLALLGRISIWLGATEATVYVWGGLFGAATLIITGMMVMKLGGNRFAVFIACLSFLCSGFLRMHVLFQPNFLDVFFWTWASYLIVRWIQTDSVKYLYWLGVCFGLGMLGKYSMAFYILSFGLAVLCTSKRKWLSRPSFYYAMALGLLIFLPNLLWQIRHHFPFMHHMDLLAKQQLQYNSRMDFIVNQLLIAFPCCFVWLGGLAYLLISKSGRKYIAIAIIYIGIISILLYFNGKGYYAAAIYPSLIAFGSVWMDKLVSRKSWRWVAYAGPAFMLFITWRILPMLLPYQSPEKLAAYYPQHAISKPALIWEDHREHALPQDFADMLGWKEMTEKTARIYLALPDSVKQTTMVYGDNYGQAAAMAFYGKKLGLPEIYSDNASFAFWLPDQFNYKHFLFVCAELPEADDAFFHHWGKTEILDSVTNPLSRQYRNKIIFYSNPDDSVKILAEKATLKEKLEFNYR